MEINGKYGKIGVKKVKNMEQSNVEGYTEVLILSDVVGVWTTTKEVKIKSGTIRGGANM